MNNVLIGISESSVLHNDSDAPMDLETKFRLVKSVGLFDYLDKTPPSDVWKEYARLSEKHDLPVLAGGWYYMLGRDENLLEQNIRIGGFLGSRVHNVQIFMDHADGHIVTDEEITDTYLRAYEIGASVGCMPMFEVHINMWSEDFRRVLAVAELITSRGIPFHITLDHSHVIFKIDNQIEQQVFAINERIESGDLILDPYKSGHICGQWIEADLVGHMHLRSAAPNNPRNIWRHHKSLESLASSQHPKSTIGRGVQYPFIRPKKGEWHSDWDVNALEPWKEVVRQAVKYNFERSKSPFSTLTAEFIPYPDYGGGAKYSIFDNACACSRWASELLASYESLN